MFSDASVKSIIVHGRRFISSSYGYSSLLNVYLGKESTKGIRNVASSAQTAAKRNDVKDFSEMPGPRSYPILGFIPSMLNTSK